MGSSSFYRKVGVVAASTVAASLIAAGGSAQAATHVSTTVTKGGRTVAAPATATPGSQGGAVYLTPKRKPGQVGPMATYACFVAFPVATVTQFHQTT